jgi:hypothetical protein
VPNSVLEAIKLGLWDFEPNHVDETRFASTTAMPGTEEKLAILAQRVQKGLPLWHSKDRRGYDDEQDDLHGSELSRQKSV